MDDEAILLGTLLSKLAGILEEASVLAASNDAVNDPIVLDALHREMHDAAAVLETVQVIHRRRRE